MHDSLLRSIFIVVIALYFASSCSKSGRFGSASGTVSEEFVTSLVNGKGYNTVTTAINSAATSGSSRTLGRRIIDGVKFRLASPLSDCTPSYSGDQTDADKDNLWTNATATIGCTSGGNKLNGSLKVVDENDNLKFPAAGALTELGSSHLDIGIGGEKRLLATFEPSHLSLKISTATSALDLSFAGTIESSGWKVTSGIEINGSYTGDGQSPKAGDTIQGSGFYQLKIENIPNLSNIDVVVSVEAALTMGTCPGKTKVEPVSGQITIKDGGGNTIALSIADCGGTLTYNGKLIKTFS